MQEPSVTKDPYTTPNAPADSQVLASTSHLTIADIAFCIVAWVATIVIGALTLLFYMSLYMTTTGLIRDEPLHPAVLLSAVGLLFAILLHARLVRCKLTPRHLRWYLPPYLFVLFPFFLILSAYVSQNT